MNIQSFLIKKCCNNIEIDKNKNVQIFLVFILSRKSLSFLFFNIVLYFNTFGNYYVLINTLVINNYDLLINYT